MTLVVVENKSDDLQLEPKTKTIWEQALDAFQTEPTRNIYTAMSNTIQHAESYIDRAPRKTSVSKRDKARMKNFDAAYS